MSQVVLHEEFNGHTLDNDIAVARVDPPFNINNDTVAPVRLDIQGTLIPEGTLGNGTGWGNVSEYQNIQYL